MRHSFKFYFHLKQILSAVLESTPFAFSIRLAAAACRKDHSHLEKWLTEKLTVYKDGFVEVICMIICPKLLSLNDACLAIFHTRCRVLNLLLYSSILAPIFIRSRSSMRAVNVFFSL